MSLILQVAAGGAIGASARYLVGAWSVRHLGTGFPWGTLAVNVVGSLLMGLAAVLVLRRPEYGLQHWGPFLMTGILGGFTTFSAFSLETFLMVERGRFDLAMTYVVVSVVLGFLALMVPVMLMRSGSI